MTFISRSIISFSAQLDEVTGKSRNEIRDIISKAGDEPSPEYFWKLSRIIRLSNPAEIRPVLEQLFQLVTRFHEQYLSATFCFANILRQASIIGQNDSYKWAKKIIFPSNPYLAVKLYSLIALPSYTFSFDPNYEILGINDTSLQDAMADALATAQKTPQNLLHRILFTISEKDPNPNLNPSLKNLLVPKNSLTPALLRGFIALARRLISNPIPASEYYNALFPLISNPLISIEEHQAAAEAQLLFASLLTACPFAFHGKLSLLNATMAQFKCGNLQPEFLSSILSTFGLSALQVMKDIISEILPGLLEEAGRTINYIEAIAPYARFLPPKLQVEAHEALYCLCTRYPFNQHFFAISGAFISNSSPTQSPTIGKYIELAEKSGFDVSLFAKGCEPKMLPLLHPKRELMKVSEREKRDAQTQIQPTLKSMIVQCTIEKEVKKINSNDKNQKTDQKKDLHLFTQKYRQKLIEPPVKNENKTKHTLIPDDLEADIDIDF